VCGKENEYPGRYKLCTVDEHARSRVISLLCLPVISISPLSMWTMFVSLVWGETASRVKS